LRICRYPTLISSFLLCIAWRHNSTLIVNLESLKRIALGFSRHASRLPSDQILLILFVAGFSPFYHFSGSSSGQCQLHISLNIFLCSNNLITIPLSI
jgi:hypothetical protein